MIPLNKNLTPETEDLVIPSDSRQETLPGAEQQHTPTALNKKALV